MVGFDNSLLASLLVMKPFQTEFGAELVGSRAGVMTSMFNIGGLAAVPFLSIANDRYGRRFGMFTGCFLVVVGTIIQGTSNLTHSLASIWEEYLLLDSGFRWPLVQVSIIFKSMHFLSFTHLLLI
jgi:MFS family permease